VALAAAMNCLCRDCFWTAPFSVARCPACGSPRLLAHDELFELSIAHLDCDAFYASVEKRDRPELGDQPLIIGGGKRGVVTTACYIARVFGVRSAMPMYKARQLCPHAVVLPPDFAKYRAESRRILEKARALTPLVQPLSLDEAWMDLSGTERLHGAPPAATLARLQQAIEQDIGLGVSLGLAPNKFLAKIASEMEKPRGFAVIGAQEAKAVLAPLSVAVLPGVGPALCANLASAGLRTVGDVASMEPGTLPERYGAQGLRLARLARGEDARAVDPRQARKSISAETTFDDDLTSLGALEDHLWPLCERVARHARNDGLAGRAVTLKLRAPDFRIATRRHSLSIATQTARSLFRTGAALLAAEAKGKPWRLIGIGLSQLEAAAALPSGLFVSSDSRALDGERAIDALRDRFGSNAVITARTLKP
jgi:DNA polymerase-4